MTVPVDLALLETATLAAAGGLLGLSLIHAQAAHPSRGTLPSSAGTFLLVWIPPALVRLLLIAQEARPGRYPELALPMAAPASLALAFLVFLLPLAFRNGWSGTGRRRGVLAAAGAAAIVIVVIGFVTSPFHASRFRSALAEHERTCSALLRTKGRLPPNDARHMASVLERETNEASTEATQIHSRRGLSPALARLAERRLAFEGLARPLAAQMDEMAERRSAEAARASLRAPKAIATAVETSREAGCASVEAGMPAAEVERLLGRADERLSAEDVLGPRAERWAYERFRCRIHLVDEVVEFVD